jgi:predicted acylesterase/phospholipase RssA
MVVHRRGELMRSILATTALPGILPPVLWDRQLLVDGGIMDNNPVAVMRAQGAGPVVVVDVGQAEASMVDERLADLPSNLEAVIRRMNPFARKYTVPTAVDVVMRTMTVGRPSSHPERDADLYVRPPVDGWGMTDFGATNAMIAVGYNATMEAIEARADDEAFLTRFGLTAEQLRSLPRMEVGRKPTAEGARADVVDGVAPPVVQRSGGHDPES